MTGLENEPSAGREDGLVLRPSGEHEAEAIRAVIAESFPDNPKSDEAILRWQYWRNPFGPSPCWVWDDGGRVVGHYTGIPVPILFDSRPATAAIGVDAAIAPTHQGRRLFESLARALYTDCGRHGMPVTICYPNSESVRGISRAGWREVDQLATYVLPLDEGWMAERFHLPRLVASVARRLAFRMPESGSKGRKVDGPPEGLDGLWSRASCFVTYGIIRDAAWWRWRYSERPGSAYRYYEVREEGRLKGAAAVTEREAFGGRFVYVLEFEALEPETAVGLARAIAADSGNAVALALATRAGTRLAGLASSAGFRRLPRRLEPKPLRFGVVDNLGEHPDVAAAPWCTAWGDLDHV
ncbi:MAG: GNAT family N-acetyltransferase [Actinomycetota bacterium]